MRQAAVYCKDSAASLSQKDKIMGVPQAASSVADAIKAGLPLAKSDTDQLLAAAGEELSASEAVCLVQVVRPFLRSDDWLRYVSEEGLPLNGLTLEEREGLESAQSEYGLDDSDVANNPVVKEIRRRDAEHMEWAEAESPLVQRLEFILGADASAVEGIATAVGSTSDDFLFFPDMPADLQAGLSAAAQQTDYRREYHLFLHDLLRTIGLRRRMERQIVALCGRELGILFPGEMDPKTGTYRFRQACYLLEDRLAVSPDDMTAVAWLAELSLRRSDVEAARSLASRLWSLSSRSRPTDLARLVHFSLAYYGNYDEPTFDGQQPCPGQLGELEGEWFDRNEPLADALLRRAFAGNDWNADLVQTVVDLCFCINGGRDFSDDIMPPYAWVWVAHSLGQAGPDYYPAWERAIAAAIAADDGATAMTAVPYLIGGALRGRVVAPRYVERLDVLRRNANAPDLRRSAAKIVAGVANFNDRLPILAKVTLGRLAAEFADDMVPQSQELADEGRGLADGLCNVEQQEPRAIKYLGLAIWEQLSPRTQQLILQVLGVYEYFRKSPGDRREYGTMFAELANAIVYEVDVQFSTILRRRWSIFDDWDYQKLLDQKRLRSLGSLPHLFKRLGSESHVKVRRDSAALQKKGIRLETLLGLIPDIKRLAAEGAQSGRSRRGEN